MFFIAHMSREIEMHPRFFGPKLREALQAQINKEVRCRSLHCLPADKFQHKLKVSRGTDHTVHTVSEPLPESVRAPHMGPALSR